MNLEVTFTPADFAVLKTRDLSRTGCVVFDVLRATSTMVTALENGARRILPVEDIAEALAAKQRSPDILLAGERHGLRITAAQTGSIDFDFGNSPREFLREKVSAKTLVMTTTNGTRGLRACTGARLVLAAAFLNLAATASCLIREGLNDLIVVCSGTFEEAAYEDTLAAGALCDLLWAHTDAEVSDSALMARNLYLAVKDDLLGALGNAKNGRRLLRQPALRDDVAFCARLNSSPRAFRMDADGFVVPA